MQHKTSHPTASLGFGIHRAESESKETVRKARILVVDNDVESCRFLNARLAGGRYRVDTVDNSQAALDSCVRSRPNLVISEFRLGDGRMRRHDNHGQCRPTALQFLQEGESIHRVQAQLADNQVRPRADA